MKQLERCEMIKKLIEKYPPFKRGNKYCYWWGGYGNGWRCVRWNGREFRYEWRLPHHFRGKDGNRYISVKEALRVVAAESYEDAINFVLRGIATYESNPEKYKIFNDFWLEKFLKSSGNSLEDFIDFDKVSDFIDAIR